MVRTHAETQAPSFCTISSFCNFPLLLLRLFIFTLSQLFTAFLLLCRTKACPLLCYSHCIFREEPGESITQIHRVVVVIVYNAAAERSSVQMSRCEFGGKLFSFICHTRIAWKMSAVRAHWVIKFRFKRLISILIKTLTPPLCHQRPPGGHSSLVRRETDRPRERTAARERERDR